MNADFKQAVLERLQLGFRKKLPMQHQTEASECSLACLAMVASYHGFSTDVATLRKRFPLSLKGATLTQLVEIAGGLDLVPRPLRLEMHELGHLQLPCILHWNLDHFVVLKKVTRTGIVVHDPARGVRSHTFAEAAQRFTGVAVELAPSHGFQPRTERRTVKLREMMGTVTGLKRSLTQIAILALVLEAFTLIAPFFNQWVIDQAIVAADVDLLVTLAIGFGVLKIISVAVEVVRGYAILVMSTTLNVQWLANLFSHMLKLPIDYFQKRHMGDVVSRFNSIHSIQSTLTTSFVGAILDGIMTVGTLIMMTIYSPFLSCIGLVAVVSYIILRFALYAALLSATESSIVHDARQQSLFMETIRGIQSIRLFLKEKDRTVRWLNAVVSQKNASLRTQRLGLMFGGGNSLLFKIEEVIVVAFGAKLVIDGLFSIGMLFAFLSYKEQFSTRVTSFIDKLFELKMLKLQGERLADIALAEPEYVPVSVRSDLHAIEPAISVEDVTFAYGAGEKPVLANVSFQIGAGESVAITGPSGCGKSTLMKLMLGILHPQKGVIRIGGIPLNELGPGNYRKLVATVMQEDTLFAGSIGDNISFFATDADQDWIEECAKMASLHKEIEMMPMGYNSLVGDMGSLLSGGQKQRLLLARALYYRPKILFLDEATSQLDIANEKKISKVVKKLSLTRVIVAHRSETIASADRVIVIGQKSDEVTVPTAPTSAASDVNLVS
ncbi:ATP-binding cassette subfamily B protein RaxB [Duganella sp. 1411]|uniref:peptidase domain-containing ABC transporter n=1 Tax=Duganella sp. 1411 TaxID=2806572 RepID=UPI001B7855BB|nr:peptidase domain-containing ABC transporter [Duganella sp. 1411]MBP1205694.1 ATP-binding cassette subfamily B protein RaxB [Duganella sp. 1411]